MDVMARTPGRAPASVALPETTVTVSPASALDTVRIAAATSTAPSYRRLPVNTAGSGFTVTLTEPLTVL